MAAKRKIEIFSAGCAAIRNYENFPHARSVAHQMNLLPPIMRTANAIHP